ncbi:MAG TPA: hypothetical protein VGZ27_18095 [Vicinamibacterales bacterium]|nr:hypothetical protein [Vicinamibacterales bacterium]
MRQRFYRPLVAILCLVASASAGSLALWPRAGSFRTEDRNGDGRPDVWRTYDRQGRLSEVAIDTNFDGRSDVHEYYEGGVLVSRESDRNFDDRVDLVQQFDYTTHEQARAIEDVDYDGRADLLVLFQGGRPVFAKWAREVAPGVASDASARPVLNPEPAPRAADDPLTPLEDPFRTDLAVKATRVVDGSSGPVAVLTSGGLPVAGKEFVTRPVSSSALELTGYRHVPSAILAPHSSRGPPRSRS